MDEFIAFTIRWLPAAWILLAAAVISAISFGGAALWKDHRHESDEDIIRKERPGKPSKKWLALVERAQREGLDLHIKDPGASDMIVETKIGRGRVTLDKLEYVPGRFTNGEKEERA